MGVRGSRRALALVAMIAALGACSDDDDATDGTLGVMDGATTVAPPIGGSVAGPPVSGAAAPAALGTGFVSIDVQVASQGIAETISLDRSTVPAASLDPVSLDATCTPLDGGDPAAGVVVSVVDLSRLAGNQIVSAVLRYGDPAPGGHEMTLELGGADQVAVTYTGDVAVADGGMSGTFSGADSGGTPVTGSFVCAAEAIATTTTSLVLDAGEEVPEGSSPPVGTG